MALPSYLSRYASNAAVADGTAVRQASRANVHTGRLIIADEDSTAFAPQLGNERESAGGFSTGHSENGHDIANVAVNARKRPRFDSDDETPAAGQAIVQASPPRRRQRYDSDDEPPRRPTGAGNPAPQGKDTHPQPIQGSRAGQVEPGLPATVYRDAQGRKVDMQAEMARVDAEKHASKANDNIARYELRTGAAQKVVLAQTAAALEDARAAPFARTADDVNRDPTLRARARVGDPLEGLDTATAGILSSKPIYRGPLGPPNRFGIRPGHRWDGTDRGNGWEEKLLDARARKQAEANRKAMRNVADL